MTKERKQEIINTLIKIYNEYEPPKDVDYETDMHMFDLISFYTRNYDNKELIGGIWVRENCPEPLKSLPA